MAKIFVSYRRDDDPSAAARVRDGLAARFGRGNVFMDVDNLLAGQRFDRELAKALSECDVLVAAIGVRWFDALKVRASAGERDYVEEEISAALRREIVVIPVRVGREGQLAALPRAMDLPESIRDLVSYQKHDVTHEHFGRDIAALADAIAALRKGQRKGASRHGLGRYAAIVGSICGVAALGYLGALWAGLPVPGFNSADKPQISASALGSAKPAPPPTPVSPPVESKPATDIAQVWRDIETQTDPTIFEAFRRQYGAANPVYETLASNKIAELARARDQSIATAQPKPPTPATAKAVPLPGPVPADTWPTRPVTIVVPFPAGGASDSVGRLVSEALSDTFKQPFIIENVPGGAGAVGAERVAKSAPDGATFLIGTQATFSRPNYNGAESLTPVALIGEMPAVVVGRKTLPAGNLKELKSNPGLTFGSGGIGSAAHMSCEQLSSALRVPFTHVPYRGIGPALNDLVGGHLDLMCGDFSTVGDHVKGGSVKALAVMASQRLPSLPNVPTAEEQGVSEDAGSWVGVFGPKGVPKAVIAKISSVIANDRNLRGRIDQLGISPPSSYAVTPVGFEAYLIADRTKWNALVKSRSIRLD